MLHHERRKANWLDGICMQEDSRLGNSVRNVLVAWGGQIVSILLSFVTRGVFAYYLSQEYMGIETLFSNVLTILCMADLGIGSAITFALYGPIACGETEKIKALMRIFKIAYVTIGVAIACIGFGIAPFISLFIENAPDIPHLEIYFLFFVLNTAVSYFFSYKGSLIYAHQKNYIVVLIQYSFQIAMYALQLAVLFFTQNYFLFLSCMLLCTLLQNICLAHTANKMFPYLRESNIEKVDKKTLDGIKKNTFALILHKISGALSVSSGSLFISAFVGLVPVGIYGSYMMVINALGRLVDKAFDAITASVGNLGATESKKHQYDVFKTSFFINALIYSVLASGLVCCFNDLIVLWLGHSYEFPFVTVVLLVVWCFVKGVRSAEQSFTSAYGLYWFTRHKALAEAISLILLSYVFVNIWQVNGVILAGVLTMGLIATTMEVYMLYRHAFADEWMGYYWIRYGLYFVVTVALSAVACFICSLVSFTGIAALLLKAVIAVVVSLSGFLLLFSKTEEFASTMNIVRRFIPARFSQKS